MQLNNNTILITGGNRGIGFAMAQRFLSLGNTVIITGRNTDKLKEVNKNFPEIYTIACDITKQDDVDRLVHTIEQQFPDLNVLINNAGVQYNYDFAMAPDTLHKVEYEMSANLFGPVKLISLLLPLLDRSKNSAIVNVTSALGIVPKQSAPVYCATKAGLHIFTQALRYQLKNIKVFEVIPSLVDTDMTRGRGKNKISPKQLVDEFIRGFEHDKYEINIGKVKILRLLQRISPILANSIINK